jgi:hypothetical protein
MLIYQIPNAAQTVDNFVCDSQTTIDARPKDPKTGQYIIPASQCSVGGQPEADAMLASNQSAWLTQQANLFTVDLQTSVDGGVVWTVVNLATQEPNTDKQYFVLDPTDGLYEPAIGLDAAKALLASIQQEYLVFTNMNVYTTMTSWDQTSV